DRDLSARHGGCDVAGVRAGSTARILRCPHRRCRSALDRRVRYLSLGLHPDPDATAGRRPSGMSPELLILAPAVHVLGVVLWIGGVAFVTAVLLPALRASGEEAMFEQLENRFAWIARGATLLVGISGYVLVAGYDLWDRFASLADWWMHAMVAVWAIFTIIL